METSTPAFAIPDAQLFVSTVERGSFSAAADCHGVTASGVSKAVSRLEAQLGVRLLVRTTRRLRLTDEGALFFDKCRDGLRLIGEAAELASETSRSLRGVLRVGMPPPIALHIGIPILRTFMAEHPELSVDLVRMVDVAEFYALRVDCAVVVGSPKDATLAGRELGPGRLVRVASPEYLARRGRPETPQELARHDCIAYTTPRGTPILWRFQHPGAPESEILELDIGGRLRVDQATHAVAAALEGLGIAQVPLFQVAQEIAAGRLVRLMPALETTSIHSAWLVFPAQRLLPRRVRAFVDHVLQASLPEPSPALRRSVRLALAASAPAGPAVLPAGLPGASPRPRPTA